MAFSKIILNGVTQIDLTQDTVAAENLISPNTAHGADGEPITGEATGGGNEFIITLSKNSTTGYWEPDKTFAEMEDAFEEEKIFVVKTNVSYTQATADGGLGLTESGTAYSYEVHEFVDEYPNPQVYVIDQQYTFRTSGLTKYFEGIDYDTYDGDALANEVPNGKIFYNSTGRVIGSATSRVSSDLTVSGATVTAPAGFYSSDATKTISSGSATTPATSITANPTISVNTTTGLITASTSASQSVTPTVSAGYVSSGTAGTVSVSGSNTSQLSTQAGATITPTESEQTAVAANKYTLGAVKVGAISPTYVGSGIDQNDSDDLTVSGATVTAPAGYYASSASKSVASGSATTPATTITADPSISVNSSGLITATTSESQNITPSVSAGYVSSGTAGTVTVSGSKTQQLTTQAAKTVTPTESEQTAVASGVYTTGIVKVGAISSTYVGSGIARKSSSDAVVDGPYVDFPAGYYAESHYGTIPSGTEGTPIATKGTVSNHSINITPSVINSEGFISGGTQTGTAVTVSASELVNGTYTVDSSGTKDVTNYASVTIPAMTLPNNTSSSRVGTQIASILPQTYRSFLNIPAGYNDTAQSYYIGGAELISLAITENGTYDATDQYDVYGFSTVTVSVPTSSGGGTNYERTTIVPQATITPNSSTRHASVAGTSDGLIDAAYYIVTYDGVEWLTTCETLWTENYCIGDVGWFFSVTPSDYIYPFGVIYEDGTYTVAAKDTNQHIIKIERLEFTSGGDSIKVGNLEGIPSTTSSISFTGLEGEPTSFYFMVDTSVATGTPGKIVAVVFDGTTLHAQTITNTSNAQVTYDTTSLSKTYSNGTLTITSSNISFVSEYYYGSYTYDSNTIYTKDVQVGSGATSITFTGLEDEPTYWSCIFKSNFGTSSGYQRVIYVAKTSTGLSGVEMDSGSHNALHWTASYNNGSFTITSQGTNAGGYFHQPGYYQLTYAIEGDSGSGGSSELNLQAKTNISPTTSSQTITADSGYDGLSSVQINAMPTMTLPSSASSTSSGTSKATISRSTSNQYINIPTGYNSTAQYYTISATPNMTLPTAASSTLSGTAKATITPSTSAQYLNIPTGYNGTAQYYTISAVTYSTIRTGTTTPASSLGSNGDVYIKTS